MGTGILLSAAADIDFMIHWIFYYEFFGHEVWITTTHVCLLIILIVLTGFAVAANAVMKKATDVPGVFQNIVELIVEMLDKMTVNVMGKMRSSF